MADGLIFEDIAQLHFSPTGGTAGLHNERFRRRDGRLYGTQRYHEEGPFCKPEFYKVSIL